MEKNKISNEKFELEPNALKKVIDNLMDVFEKERKADPEYKDMFKNAKTYSSFLSNVIFKLNEHNLDACAVLEKKFNVHISEEVYRFVLSLPLLDHLIEKEITKTEGITCCVDKTHYLLSNMLETLINKQKKVTDEKKENNKI